MLPTLIDDPRHYDDKILSAEEILGWFDVYDAVWMHDGRPESPHAELSGGKCSNGFFDCMRVLCNPKLCEILARQLVRKLKEAGIEKVDWVIGSPYAAITFSHEVAKGFNAVHAFTEKDPRVIPTDPKRKGMLWQRMQIPKNAIVLQVEELITTSRTFKEVRWAVEKGNYEPIEWLPVVGTLVHRPPTKLPVTYDGIEIVSLVEVEIEVWTQEDCPLCKIGSPRYRPKENWAKLTGKA